MNAVPHVGRSLDAFRQSIRTHWFNMAWEPRLRRKAQRASSCSESRSVVHLYAPCWNEEHILPYFLDHYDAFITEYHIYDKGSTNATLGLLARHPRVTVIPSPGGAEYDELRNLEIKNEAWKASAGRADFVVVCDMDEFLYHPHLGLLLAWMKQRGKTIVKPTGFQMVSERLPEFDGTPLTRLVTSGMPDAVHGSKTVLFDPNALKKIQFLPGCHVSRPEGRIRWYQSDRLKLLHYKYVDRGEFMRKFRIRRDHLSALCRERNWGRQYLKTDEQFEKGYDWRLANAREVI